MYSNGFEHVAHWVVEAVDELQHERRRLEKRRNLSAEREPLNQIYIGTASSVALNEMANNCVLHCLYWFGARA